MGFAKDYLWAKLGGRPPDTRMRKLLRKSGGGGGGPITEGEFGVEWDYSAPSPALTRTGDAVGFADPIPATSLVDVGASPFDNIMPWAGMRMCNIINGEVVYWQGDPQFSETDYDTMVYIPEFWYKAEKDTATSKWRWSISPSEKEGYVKHPGSGRYIGRFHSSGSGAGVYSKSDAMPLVSTNRTNFRSYSHSKGAKWWMLDIATWSALQLLYLVEFANFNSQDKLGTGQVSGSVTASGGTTGAVYHTFKRSGDSNQYRWVEDPYSNVCDWVDGFIAPSRKAYLGTDNSDFTDATSSLTDSGITLPASNFITGFGFSTVFPWSFLPDAASGGSETTYVTDRISTLTGNNALFVGGGYDIGANKGMFCGNANYAATYTFPYLGSRLIYIPS